MRGVRVVSRGEFIAAQKLMLDALGIDIFAVYDEGFSMASGAIHGLTCVKPDDASEESWVPVGNDPTFQERAWPFVIKVDESTMANIPAAASPLPLPALVRGIRVDPDA